MEHSDTSFYEESHTKVNEAGELKILMKQNMNTRSKYLCSTGLRALLLILAADNNRQAHYSTQFHIA